MIKIEDPNPYGGLDESRLLAFEGRLGSKLPDDYRLYLLAYNGGEPARRTFAVRGDHGHASLHHVLGLHDGPDYFSLEAKYDFRRPQFKSRYLQVADTETGDAVVLALTGRERGAVYFYDHESFFRRFKKQADSFNSFLESMLSEEEWLGVLQRTEPELYARLVAAKAAGPDRPTS